jgi:hypothetical protein
MPPATAGPEDRISEPGRWPGSAYLPTDAAFLFELKSNSA